jgi:hypothetical protein
VSVTASSLRDDGSLVTLSSRRAVLRLIGGTVILEGNSVAEFFFSSVAWTEYLNAAGSFYQVLS